MDNLIVHFKYSLYQNICRSIYERDKPLFSLQMCVRLMQVKT